MRSYSSMNGDAAASLASDNANVVTIRSPPPSNVTSFVSMGSQPANDGINIASFDIRKSTGDAVYYIGMKQVSDSTAMLSITQQPVSDAVAVASIRVHRGSSGDTTLSVRTPAAGTLIRHGDPAIVISDLVSPLMNLIGSDPTTENGATEQANPG